jgi:hypothetical protein
MAPVAISAQAFSVRGCVYMASGTGWLEVGFFSGAAVALHFAWRIAVGPRPVSHEGECGCEQKLREILALRDSLWWWQRAAAILGLLLATVAVAAAVGSGRCCLLPVPWPRRGRRDRGASRSDLEETPRGELALRDYELRRSERSTTLSRG